MHVTLRLEAHLPEPGSPSRPSAVTLAAALRQSAEEADRAVRDHRAPTGEPVHAALATRRSALTRP
ncbi:hypothetical protein [Streptomyces sp. NBC_01264]|uniref:hypothetical protein n=1 Tax=Streptomyces sp. NBC_01264 TaxID=2903804 RepID=UPI00225BA12D|nr:hypothetical protein [Streptomyces sp. NBC_01264]MCX4781916.1 hypothetical protein [Streptomyces sp. NBC_01264]